MLYSLYIKSMYIQRKTIFQTDKHVFKLSRSNNLYYNVAFIIVVGSFYDTGLLLY